jgi:hypothetical protein
MDLTDQARSFFLWNKGGEGRAGRISPGGGGGIPGGVERPRILRAGPAGTTEGGDHLPRRCRTRGEANRKKIPFLKSRISKTSEIVPFSEKTRTCPEIKQFPYQRPFASIQARGISPRFPENGNGERESTGLQSCNRGHEGDRCMYLFLLLFTKFPHGPFLAALNGIGKRSEPGKKGEGK